MTGGAAGIGYDLYRHFFAAAENAGCTMVRCITSPVNKGSIAFHQRLGFTIESSEKVIEGIPLAENHDGKGGDRVLFFKKIGLAGGDGERGVFADGKGLG